MRVLLVLTPPLDPTTGGVQMSTVKMARMLSTQGHEVGVFSFANEGHASTASAELFPAPADRGTANPENLAALRDCLQSYQPQVVVSQMPYADAITDILQEHHGAHRIACLRNTLYSVRSNLDQFADTVLPRRLAPLVKNPLGRAALLYLHKKRHARDLRAILTTYDRFVMFAEPNLDELAYFVPDYDRAKIALVPNSIPEVASRVPAKGKRILWLARVSAQQKRADLILPIWRRIFPHLPDWSLDVVGDGPLLGELRRAAAAEQLPRIEFHGRQPSQPFFERSAVYLMTSDFEGFPNTLIEAQSRGAVPVVFDSYPMVRWLIQHADNGLLVPKGDVDGMAKAVVALCQSSDRYRLMGEHALATAERFTESEVAPQWNALLDEVVRASSVQFRNDVEPRST